MANEAPATTAPVDWNMISEEILCPLCDYNLRGLIEPRCPECGSRYQWNDLLDPKRRKHPYLFEHHPEMNWTSFWRTARGGLRPIKFWRSLHPVQPSNPRRLVLYALIILIGWYPLLTVSEFLISMRAPYQGYVSLRSPAYVNKLDALNAAFHSTLAVYQNPSTASYTLITCLIIGWPILTLMTLMIFAESMRGAKVKTIHVVRCVVYSADVLLWFGIAMALLRPNQALLYLSPLFFYVVAVTIAVLRALSFTLPKNLRRSRLLGPVLLTADLVLLTAIIAVGHSIFEAWFNPAPSLVGYAFYEDVSVQLALVCLLLETVKLITAYKIYLQFDRPIATVLASQAIVALVILNAVVYLTWY